MPPAYGKGTSAAVATPHVHVHVAFACCGLHTVKPGLPEHFEASTWAMLHEAVRAVHSQQPVSCSLEQLYTVGTCAALLRL